MAICGTVLEEKSSNICYIIYIHGTDFGFHCYHLKCFFHSYLEREKNISYIYLGTVMGREKEYFMASMGRFLEEKHSGIFQSFMCACFGMVKAFFIANYGSVLEYKTQFRYL